MHEINNYQVTMLIIEAANIFYLWVRLIATVVKGYIRFGFGSGYFEFLVTAHILNCQ